LGITSKLEVPNVAVDLIDIDNKALEVAKKNAKKFEVGVHCIVSDLLTAVTVQYDIMLANLPYVPDNFQVNSAAMHEPKLAIFGGKDGLDVYRKLFLQIASLDRKPQYIFTESLPPQHKSLSSIAESAGFKLTITNDFIQQFEKGG
jgi:release factor glutamine methyltransferase